MDRPQTRPPRLSARLYLLGALAFVIAAALANLPGSGWFPPDPETRRQQVVSAFINASAEPGQGAEAFRVDWLVSDRQRRKHRSQRLAHVHPAVQAAFAEAMGVSVPALRERIADPRRPDGFEISGVRFDHPDSFAHGSAGGWNWALVTGRPPEAAKTAAAARAACGLERPCGLWLVHWTDEAWYFAPLGTPELEALLLSALPELAAAVRQARGRR